MKHGLLVVVLGVLSLSPLSAQTSAPVIAPDHFGLLNGSTPEPGLLAAGQPTAEDLAEVAAAGYKTVLDLRAPGEDRGFDEPALVRELGLTYVNLPFVTAELDAATLDRFRELLRTAERPVLVHCGTSNRVGAALFAHWVLDAKLDLPIARERAATAGLKSPELAAKVEGLVVAAAPP
jgi:uncharacterized protein (TIGR01244 family)